MSSEDRYYKGELEYLDRAGQEYAKLHPQRAQALGVQDVRSRDPHVERLVQSFAWLTGRVHRRLDDDFPQLTHSLIDLIWPHYLRPVPSLAMLQLRPIRGMNKPERVAAGLKVKSRQTSIQVRCPFRTLYPVDLYPLTLDDAQVIADEAGQRQLRLRLRLLEGARPEEITLDRLRLYLMGEPSVTFCVYRLLLESVRSIRLRFGRDRTRVFDRHDARRRLRAVGFAEDEAILPYPSISFPGYRLLAEYFVFPEKFLFVDLLDLGGLALERHEETFELFFDFDERLPDTFRPTTENFQLYVTPILNVFTRDGEPIKVEHLHKDEEVVASYTYPHAYEVLSVDRVVARRSGDNEARQRHPFFSFEHDRDDGEADGVYYHVRQGFTPSGRWQTRLALISPAQRAELPAAETLTLELTCLNGRLCGELGIGDVTETDGEKPLGFAVFRNVTRPTAPVYPRLGTGMEWSFVSHMALNVLSLGDAAALRRILALYDMEARQENRRRIDGIVGAETRSLERLIGGAPVRGTELRLHVDESRFAEEGDLLLFSRVLSEFLAYYASANSFTRLVVAHTSPEREDIRCEPVAGRQSLI